MAEEEAKPIIQLSQNLIIGIAIAAAVLAVLLYYENRQMREQLAMLASSNVTTQTKKPCNCDEHVEVNHSPAPSVMPTEVKPPEVVVD